MIWGEGEGEGSDVLLFLSKRMVAMLLTMLSASVLVFVVLEVSPGSVATKVLGPYSSPEQRQLWLVQHGYSAPLARRYLAWLGEVALGDFGYSTRFKTPVHAILWPRLAHTALLGRVRLSKGGGPGDDIT